MAPCQLLLIEDDAPLRRSLVLMLADEGFGTVEAATGQEGLQQLDRSPDVVLLDLGLPDVDGIDLRRRLREGTASPIVVLSGRRRSDDLLRALAAGADEFLSKPFPSGELARRLQALLAPRSPEAQALGLLQLDLQRHGLVTDGVLVPLTRTELRLLSELAAQPEGVGADTLMERVWGVAPVAGAAALDARILSLGAKVAGSIKITNTGAGWGLRHEVSNGPPE